MRLILKLETGAEVEILDLRDLEILTDEELRFSAPTIGDAAVEHIIIERKLARARRQETQPEGHR